MAVVKITITNVVTSKFPSVVPRRSFAKNALIITAMRTNFPSAVNAFDPVFESILTTFQFNTKDLSLLKQPLLR
ncbi:hypothetical protein Barb4_02392 [Bacteroidales bacterium Barb4]|nr:hypothetical protein Barb4_02392 [Bacteroidales bacterium Barb4]